MNKVINFLKSHKIEIIFFFITYLILLVNSIHENYPDEMDNILGGYLINLGELPYTGFFTHHGPLAYYLASFLTLFSGQSFVKFRLLSSIFFLFLLIISYITIKKRIRSINPSFFFFYILILVLSSTYYWFHMFLADPLSGFFFIPAYALVFLKIYKKEALGKMDLILISIFSSLSVINSATYSYAVFILIVFTFFYYLFFLDFKILFNKLLFKNILVFVVIFAVPYLFFVLFLLITQSFGDYYFQALIYNRNYYIYNYPKPVGSSSFNPIRYAIIIINEFVNSYQVLLSGVKNVDFINPLNVTFALSNLVLWIFLIIKKRYFLFLFSILLIIFVNVRSQPIKTRASDYQASVYLMLSFLNSSFLLFFLKDELNNIKNYIFRILLTILFVLVIIFWFFSTVSFFGELWRISFLRYMGKMPLIYDRPQVANMVNDIVPKKDYCWVGPFDFEEIFYLDCKLPSRFHIIRRFFIEIPSFKNEMMDSYSRNMPDVVVYRRQVFGQGAKPEDKFFTDFLDKNYILFKDYKDGNKYIFKSGNPKDYNLPYDLNLEKTKAKSLIKKLYEKGYIDKSN
ncbi:hypothetical protein C4559_03315 [Candidatus Microgenomates bacterium]|nr:MAG: hypothetical protein C4559_03315 [Candidatus Microgenomates bacterium]